MQRYTNSLHVIGILLMIFSISMLPPMGVSIYYNDHALMPFVIGFIATLIAGITLWRICPASKRNLNIREGFLVVVLFWVILSLFGAIPFALASTPYLNFTNAFFESVSGLTTTGATTFAKVSNLPRDILYYREQLQLMGGLGVIVLAVAVLPMLGVGGMQLFRAEITGPIKDTKTNPRMSTTAKSLWIIYIGLAIAAGISFWIAGMRPFDAICNSFSVVSTGGLTIHDSSFAFYNSVPIDMIAVVFMLLGAINFCLHFGFLYSGNIKNYWRNTETRVFIGLILITSLFIGIWINFLPGSPGFWNSLEHALFTTVSVATTTGITTSRFSAWPVPIAFLLMFVAIIGGCSGSTSGGIKIIRFVVLAKQGMRELKQLLHPQAFLPLKIDDEPLPQHISRAIWAFLSLFVVIFIALWLALLATGLNVTTAFGAIAACISSCGASIGGVANNYEHISITAKWILIFAMLTGRLEIFTVLILFTREFWRK